MMLARAFGIPSATERMIRDDERDDRQVVLAAVAQDGLALEFASETLRNDRQVVLAAIAQWCYALQFASDALRNDRQVTWRLRLTT